MSRGRGNLTDKGVALKVNAERVSAVDHNIVTFDQCSFQVAVTFFVSFTAQDHARLRRLYSP